MIFCTGKSIFRATDQDDLIASIGERFGDGQPQSGRSTGNQNVWMIGRWQRFRQQGRAGKGCNRRSAGKLRKVERIICQ